MRVGLATDHGGFDLKQDLLAKIHAAGHEVIDFGASVLNSGDDYPNLVIPLARAVAAARSSAAWRFAAAGYCPRRVVTVP